MSGPEPGGSPTPEAPPPSAPPPSAPPPGDAWASAQAPAQVPGHAGLFFADVPNRVIALIIDVIVVAIVSFILSAIVYSVLGWPTTVKTVPDTSQILGVRFETTTNYVALFAGTILGVLISAAYYLYTWTKLRGTLGQKALGMQVGNAFDGVTLTMEQAIKRWLALGGVFALAQFLNPLPLLGLLIGLAGFVWFIALLYTTATSPTKQGLHDKYANSVVVKAARSV